MKLEKYMIRFRIFFIILVASIFFSCRIKNNSGNSIDNGNDNQEKVWVEENKLIDETFRIDISSIDVEFRFVPEERVVYGKATVLFKMRNGENFPVIHFDPVFNGALLSVFLDDVKGDFSENGNIRKNTSKDTKQDALEFLTDCSDGKMHKIEMTYKLAGKFMTGSFYTSVNDISGNGNEDLFPTINAPSELARHRITFIVESNEKYRCIGSGKVTDMSKGTLQKWILDSGREIASYTVMFFLIPESETDYREDIVNGVEVRVVAYKDNFEINDVFDSLESWLPELEKNLGPFPMPDGLSVFLTSSGGGMEYYGGTITSFFALNHEVFHMYFGCSLIAKTYRDSWWDEAINMWYEKSLYGIISAIPDSFRSNIVSGRTPVSIGFDDRAYNEGAMVIEACAQAAGGRDNFIGFLKYLYEKYTFFPFNTFGLVEYFRDYSGVDMNSKFLDWLYNSVQSYYLPSTVIRDKYHKVDLTPPKWIIEKYKKR